MPRRGDIPKRRVLPDPKYKSVLVSKMVNALMWRGKKGVAYTIVYDAMSLVAEKTKEEPLKALQKAVDAVKPFVEVKSRRVGGATYQVPIDVRSDRQQTLALRWLMTYSRARNEHSMAERLGGEIIDALNGRGGAVKKREDTHRMAEANKAFAHYRW